MDRKGPPVRIMLIHALAQSVAPIHHAFAQLWPEAERHDLLDSSLSADLAAAGGTLTPGMIERFRSLGRYAADAVPAGRRTDGILFTCSAFGPAIDAVRREAAMPVLKPNEAAFAEALARGGRVALLVTFAPALAPMLAEFHELRRAQGGDAAVEGCVVSGALDALRAGQADAHDERIAAVAADQHEADIVILGQFSMSRAAAAVQRRVGARTVLTTPESAVRAMRRRVETRASDQAHGLASC